MRILEAFGEPIADGGQEAFVFGVLDRIDMNGLFIDCLTAYDCRSDYYREKVEMKGGKVFALNLPFAPGRSREMIRAPFRAFLKVHFYDVVHIHSGSTSVLAIMAREAHRAGVKRVIVHSHVAGERDSLKHVLLRWIASLSMKKNVDIYCACSKEAAQWKFEPKYVKVTNIIKNGIDSNAFRYNPVKREELRQRLGLEDAFVIGHVGRFMSQKNHEFLIEVFQEVLSRCDKARLLLVGDGENMQKIQRLVEERRLRERVIFTGSVSNVSDYLQAMDVFVMPSKYEGLPIAAIEAQSTGLPAIVSDCVSHEIELSPDVHFLDLDLGSGVWADCIVKLIGRSRKDNSDLIRAHGFDISDTAKEVRKMYDPDGIG